MKIIDINGNERACENVVPDPAFPGFLEVVYLSKKDGAKLPKQWYPIEKFLKNNPKLKHLLKATKPEPKEDVGQVTSAGPDFLRDNTKRWDEDVYINYPLWISRGKGEGQVRKIITNTKNMLTLDKEWETKPDESSQYVISYNLPITKAQGNTIPGFEMIDVINDQN